MAIIGGGIIGAACAYELVRRGLAVTLLEREAVAAGASGACDGHLTVQTKAPGIHARLGVEALALYRRLPAAFHAYVEFRVCGSLLVATSAAEVDALEALAASRREDGLAAEILTGAEARRREPALTRDVLAASHAPGDAQANPWRITQWFARAAADGGARIMIGAEARELVPQAWGVRVRLAEGEVRAGRVVVAAGAWCPGVSAALGPLPILPRRGEVLVTEPLPPQLSGLVISASYLARKFSAETQSGASLAAEQTPAGNVLLGGTRQFAGMDCTVSPRGCRDVAQEAVRLLPALEQAHVIRAFAGLRPHTPDGLPLLGPLPGSPRILVAAGHEGDGVTLAPVTARIIADAITHEVAPDPQVSVSRVPGFSSAGGRPFSHAADPMTVTGGVDLP